MQIFQQHSTSRFGDQPLSSSARVTARIWLKVLSVLLFATFSADAQVSFYDEASLSVELQADSADSERWSSDVDLAEWRVDGGPWRPTAHAEMAMSPGPHEVEFRPVDGWQAPSRRTVQIVPGVNRIVGTYIEQRAFAVGDIPPVSAREGEVTSFLVEKPEGAVGGLWLDFERQPVGEIEFDARTGVFTFDPAPEDRGEFQLTFGAGGDLQEMTLTALPRIADESSVIESVFPVPDATSRDYIAVSIDKVDAVSPPFNHDPLLRELRDVEISGAQIVFQPGHPNQLFERFAWTPGSGIHDIQSMTIYADTVVFAAPTVFPQTNVTIWAREIRFEDHGDEKSVLETTPLVLDKPFGESGQIDGVDGLDAGDISLFVREVHLPDDEPRFLLSGGRGQEAEDGKDGVAGRDVHHFNGDYIQSCFEVWVRILGVDHRRSSNDYCSPSAPATLPTNGTHAVAAGMPGAGGDGGVFMAPFDIAVRIDAGEPGAQGRLFKGGRHGNPRVPLQRTRWVTTNTGGDVLETGSFRKTYTWPARVPGNDAESPANIAGAAGEIRVQPLAFAWVHPSVIRPTIDHARDAFLRGNPEFAEGVLRHYAAWIDAALKNGLPDETAGAQSDLEQARHEIDDLIALIENGLDYFGNPAGWVPMLSFEANLEAFESEIDSSIRTLYLSYWLGNRATNIADKSAALTEVREKALSSIPVMRNQYRETRQEIPVLRAEWERLAIQVEEIQAKVQARTDELIADAEDTVAGRNKLTWYNRVALGVGGALSFYPASGGAKIAAKGVASYGLRKGSTEEFDGGGEENDDFFSSTYETGVDEFGNTIDLLDPKAGGGDPVEIGRVAWDSFVIAPARDVQRAITNRHIPQNELEAEVAHLLAYDASYNDLLEELMQALRQKGLYALKLRSAIATLSRLASQIQQAKITARETTRSLDVLLGAMDHQTLIAIRAMERRAKDRLVWYQYVTAKSFEYRMLRAYSQDPEASAFDLNTLFEKFIELGETNVDQPEQGYSLNAEDFDVLKSAYTEELRRITSLIFNQLNENAPERSVPINFGLSDSELDELNTSGTVRINMAERGIFGSSEENIRIVNLGTRSMSVSSAGGALGSTAILRVSFAHSGVSKLRADGDTFSFQHYRDENVNPIVWRTVYDGVEESFVETSVSAAEESLLRFLLEEVGDSDDLLLYSRPAANAEIIISKEVSTDNNVDMNIDELRLQVEYDFFEKPSNQADLHLEVEGGLAPLITVDRSDMNGRDDAFGSALRVYNRGEAVRVTAIENHGAYTFDAWVDAAGDVLAETPEIEVFMNSHETLRAVYSTVGGPIVGETSFRRGDANADGNFDLSDAIFELNYLFSGGVEPPCLKSADTNDDGKVDISDPVSSLNFLFLGGTAPAAPYESCGSDPTADSLSCEVFSSCGS